MTVNVTSESSHHHQRASEVQVRIFMQHHQFKGDIFKSGSLKTSLRLMMTLWWWRHFKEDYNCWRSTEIIHADPTLSGNWNCPGLAPWVSWCLSRQFVAQHFNFQLTITNHPLLVHIRTQTRSVMTLKDEEENIIENKHVEVWSLDLRLCNSTSCLARVWQVPAQILTQIDRHSWADNGFIRYDQFKLFRYLLLSFAPEHWIMVSAGVVTRGWYPWLRCWGDPDQCYNFPTSILQLLSTAGLSVATWYMCFATWAPVETSGQEWVSTSHLLS